MIFLPINCLFKNQILHFSEAQAEIVGAPDKFIKSGSALRLTCILRKSTEPPVYVFWYHNDRMVNFDAAGVTVRHGRYSTELEVTTAKPEHSGNYSCVPSNAKSASIHVHILNGMRQTTNYLLSNRDQNKINGS